MRFHARRDQLEHVFIPFTHAGGFGELASQLRAADETQLAGIAKFIKGRAYKPCRRDLSKAIQAGGEIVPVVRRQLAGTKALQRLVGVAGIFRHEINT